MKIVYLVYRPILDYEESERSYLVTETEEKAKEIVAESLRLAKEYKDQMKEDHTDLSDEEFSRNYQHNYDSFYSIVWPYQIEFSKWDVEYNTDSFVQYREIKMV